MLLPEVFGINGWLRSVASRLAAQETVAVLVLPLFARTAPLLDLGYDEKALALGRQHRDQVTVAGFLKEAAAAVGWLRSQPGCATPPLVLVGFCFGGHLAWHGATLPAVEATLAFYGARVSSFRPGGGDPTVAVAPSIPGRFWSVVGAGDPLMPEDEQQQITAALAAADPDGLRHRAVVLPAAGHGFLCDQRDDHHPAAAATGWELLSDLIRLVAPPRAAAP
jgi:carboxymethylenebutenolidase